LNESIIFSNYTEVPDIFLEKQQSPVKPIPVPKKEVELDKENHGAKSTAPVNSHSKINTNVL
jgi:hypothetical protein